MKKLLLPLILLLSITFQVYSQDNNWTSGRFSSYLDVDANRPTNSVSEGLNIGRNYNTNIQLATRTWSGNHVIFFNAYKSSSQVPGSLITTGNSKFANSTTSYGSGAGAISFYGNGGTLDFYISGVSTGENTNVNWGTPKLRINRNGNVGIGIDASLFKLTMPGGNDCLSLGNNVFINGEASTGRITNNAYRENGVWKIFDPMARASTIEIRDSGKVEIYGTKTPGQIDWTMMFGVDAANGRSYFPNGNVGIGITNPTHKLTVSGVISATEVKVSTTPNSDYVFEPDYDLRPLQEVETFVNENKHLPDIPSAEEFKENGIGLGEMDNMLLRKVEELTLYVIELKRENEEQNKKLAILDAENAKLKGVEAHE